MVNNQRNQDEADRPETLPSLIKNPSEETVLELIRKYEGRLNTVIWEMMDYKDILAQKDVPVAEALFQMQKLVKDIANARAKERGL